MACSATLCGGRRTSDNFLSTSEGPCRGGGRPHACWLRQVGYGHGGPGVYLSDGQTEAEGLPSQGGCGDALLRRMPPFLPDRLTGVVCACVWAASCPGMRCPHAQPVLPFSLSVSRLEVSGLTEQHNLFLSFAGRTHQ